MPAGIYRAPKALESRLKIDTTPAAYKGPLSAKGGLRDGNLSASRLKSPYPAGTRRPRRSSNASSSSDLSVVSPKSSSTNESTSSLQFHPDQTVSSPFRQDPYYPESPTSPMLDEIMRLTSEYVLAMHDYAPQQDGANCLSFRAGQVIHVLNRDASGWWDGELDGQRGWFPSNYVNAEVDDTTLLEEELPRVRRRRGHVHNKSGASTTSWISTLSEDDRVFKRDRRRPSASDILSPDSESYCPTLMVPLLHALSLLQNAVRENRAHHFEPSTACIISCVRSVLSAVECLPRESPLLQRFPVLAQERKRILSVLASLVAQAKKAAEDPSGSDDEEKELEVEGMLRLSGQVFANVRRFLVVAVQCGIELPDQRQDIGSGYGSTETEVSDSMSSPTDTSSPDHQFGTPMQASRIAAPPLRQVQDPPSTKVPIASRANQQGRKLDTTSPAEATPKRPMSTSKALERNPTHRSMLSNGSSSSGSSSSSLEPGGTARFPSGPSTTAQVMEALRHTHDQYLSTIAAFIGHAHSHSRTSHASSTGHMFDLVREVVEMVCKLLTIVEAVMHHPEISTHDMRHLKAAKEGLYNVTSSLAESVRLLTVSLPSTTTEEDEKASLLRSATGALKAGADCVAAVKMCLNRSTGERKFIVHFPEAGQDGPVSSNFEQWRMSEVTVPGDSQEEDLTVQPRPSSAMQISKEGDGFVETQSSGRDDIDSKRRSIESVTMVSDDRHAFVDASAEGPASPLLHPSSPTDDGTMWHGTESTHQDIPGTPLEEKILHGDLPSPPPEPAIPHPEGDPASWMLSHNYLSSDVAYNSEGHLVGATMEVLVEKMTPHDSIVDPAFAAVFFLTFRLFSAPNDLVAAIITRYNLPPPQNVSADDHKLWEQRKAIPVRLRVSNFIKLWLEMYWRPATDNVALAQLMVFTRETIAVMFSAPAQRIMELIHTRLNTAGNTISPKGDRLRDPGMSLNPPSLPMSEVPRPTMTKTLLSALRNRNFTAISITDFDALELARQMTIMECNLYCQIQPEEVLETGQAGATAPLNVRAVSTLSTTITGWVAESILNEPDIKKRQGLVKFFIKVADRCTSLQNYSTPRSILAALDSSTISRLHQTWMGLPQKSKLQLEALRKLADHSRNYHGYRSRLRITAPPAVPFLGLYLTDVTFCREGNPSHRSSPLAPEKKLLNFNKYHKLARIVQDMQRFQQPYFLKAIPEVQEYLNLAFDNARHHGDLQDLYRRSLLVEPRQPADNPPTGDVQKLFNWGAARSQPQAAAS